MDNKKKTVIIIVCCVLAVALIAFLVWKMIHQNNEETSSDAEASDDFPLQEGSRGDKVRLLQEYLNTQLMKMQDGEVRPSLLDVDGIFGAKTATACKAVFGTDSISKSQFNEI